MSTRRRRTTTICPRRSPPHAPGFWWCRSPRTGALRRRARERSSRRSWTTAATCPTRRSTRRTGTMRSCSTTRATTRSCALISTESSSAYDRAGRRRPFRPLRFPGDRRLGQAGFDRSRPGMRGRPAAEIPEGNPQRSRLRNRHRRRQRARLREERSERHPERSGAGTRGFRRGFLRLRDPVADAAGGAAHRADPARDAARRARGDRLVPELRALGPAAADRPWKNAGVGRAALRMVQHAQRASVYHRGLRVVLLGPWHPYSRARRAEPRPSRQDARELLRQPRRLPIREAALVPYDVVIVGGGHNGLVCACYLAGAGLTVRVLERRTLVGGAAVTEERAAGGSRCARAARSAICGRASRRARASGSTGGSRATRSRRCSASTRKSGTSRALTRPAPRTCCCTTPSAKSTASAAPGDMRSA